MRGDTVQSWEARCKSASKLDCEKPLNGTGRPAGPEAPGCGRSLPRLNR
jgi:hypothetical protein